MKQVFIRLLSILVCLVIVAGFFGLLVSQFVKATIFSRNFYQESIISKAYLDKVQETIKEDLQAQSDYVGIPQAVLLAGVDFDQVYLRISEHLQQISDFMNYQADFAAINYPVDSFDEQLKKYIEKYAAEKGIEPSAAQLQQLHEVAVDSADRVSKRINLLDLDLVQGKAAFQKLHAVLFWITSLSRVCLLLAVIGILAMLAIYRKNWRAWLFYIFTGSWFAGALVLVPSITLAAFSLTSRLDLGTGYLKLAVDNLLSNANRFFIVWGSVLFVASSFYLIIHLFVFQSHHKKSKRHDGRKNNNELIPDSCQFLDNNV